MADLMPPFCGETFLRDLSIYGKKNTWEVAEPFFREKIKERRRQPYTKKHKWLQSRDITGKGTAGQKPRRSDRIPAPPMLLPSEIRQMQQGSSSTANTPRNQGNTIGLII